jgi:hypothetical protein
VALVALALLTMLTPPPAGPAGGAGTQLNLAAAGVTIGTTPSVEGFPVTLDGVTKLTDGAGRVHFNTEAGSGSRLSERITLTEAVVPIGGQDVKVTANKLYPFRPVRMLALDLSYLVRFDFSGLSGSPVDPAAIATITVKSPFGEVAELGAQDATWLQGSRALSTGSGLAVDQLEWTVQRVQFAGSNVVNTSQQRFRPAEQQTVDVKLLFFSMKLQIHDALFGHPQGGPVKLVYPDGHAGSFDVDHNGQVRITALPRGQYTLTILGPGPALSRPLAVSRDQDLRLAFYSWWDIGTLLGALVALGASLAGAGAMRRRRHAAREHAGVPGPRHVAPRPTRRGDDVVDVATAVESAPAQPLKSTNSAADLAVLGDRRAE